MHNQIKKDVNQALYVPLDTKNQMRDSRFKQIDIAAPRPGVLASTMK